MSKLPTGWVETTIGEVCNYIQRGKSPKYVESSALPVINQKCIRWAGVDERYLKFVDPEQWSSWTEERFLVPDDVLWNSTGTGTIGRAALFKGLQTADRAVVDSHVTILRTDGAVTGTFLHRFIQSPSIQAAIVDMQSGTTNQVELNRAEIIATAFPLPPLAEQKRIVAKLEALNAKSARAHTELARIDTLVSRYKQALLSKAFSGELTAHVRKPSGATIEAIISDPFKHTQSAPASWTRHLFSEVCTIVGGSQPPKATFAYAPQEGYVRLVQIRDYKSDAKATYIPKELARRFCSSTDIMIGRYGPPVFQILRGIEGAYNVALMKAEPTEAVAQEFLYWYLHYPILFKYVEVDSKRTAGQDGVNKAHLERWPILLPPLEEQHEIVRRIESAFTKIDRLANEAKRALELVGRLDEAILAKAFRGELVPQDENDEPAGSLLERIRQSRACEPSRPKRRTPATKIKVHDMARTIIEALAEAKDWLAAQELFARCGVRDGASTEDVEKLYRQLLDLQRQGKVEIGEVSDPLTGVKQGNRVRLRK